MKNSGATVLENANFSAWDDFTSERIGDGIGINLFCNEDSDTRQMYLLYISPGYISHAIQDLSHQLCMHVLPFITVS